jgi:L-iditol 2-dehydrogenase
MSGMQAVVVHHGHDFSFEMIDLPVAGPGELILQIEAAGICAADRKIYDQTHPWDLPDPYIPGHEFIGKVIELGDGAGEVTGLEIGGRVTAEILVPCRTCWFCQRGLTHHCDRPRVCVGAWAEYLKIPSGALIHRVPDDLPTKHAILVEPLACSIHAVNLAQIGLSDTVVVAGLGAIGMGVLQVARLRTPLTLIGLDVDESLLEIALANGADYVYNPRQDDLSKEIRELTDGRGADIYIEASGATAAVATGLDLLRKAGRLVLFGVYDQKAKLDLNLISEFKELEIQGGHLSPNTFPLAIKFLSEGLINAEPMVTHTFPLSEYEEAVEIKKKGKGPSIKTILIPGGTS